MKRLQLLLLALLLFLCSQPVLAQGTGSDGKDGRVVFGQDFTLGAGQRLDGNLVVFGGDIGLEEGSTVRGDVLALGGSVQVAGQVEGNVFAFGGQARLRPGAVVQGDVLGSTVREQGAVVGGRVISGPARGADLPLALSRAGGLCSAWGRNGRSAHPWGLRALGDLIASVLKTLFGALAMAALGVLVVLLIPGLTRVVTETVVNSPGQSIGVGFLTGLVVLLAVPLLVIICIGIPVAILVTLLFGSALLFGWIAVGLALGERVLGALKQPPQPLLAVAVGVTVLGILAGLPCLGLLVTVVLGAWGVGAVVLTRFGSRPYNNLPTQGAPALPLPPAESDGSSGSPL